MMELQFNLASAEQIETLIELMRAFYLHEHLPFNEPATRSSLQVILNNPTYGQIHLICIEDQVIGYLAITFGFSLEYHGRDAFIDELYIQAAYRGQGIGKQSVRFAEEICRQAGIQTLHLEVERKNTMAQATYQKAGFIEHDRALLTKWL